ncbi:MAG: DNA polymerase IV [Acidimicrobiales bacterium]
MTATRDQRDRDQPERTILHVDMDAFFVACELLRRPELGGHPVVVGGQGNRGVVAAASYEARAFGINSGMPSTRARRLCPDAVFLPGDHRYYGEVSGRVMDILRSYTPLVEPISFDEAFLDVTGAGRLFGAGAAIGAEIRRRVVDEENLTCSVGVAGNKLLAKLASEAAKPRASPEGPRPGLGVRVVEPDESIAFLHAHPVRALWGVGPATMTKLERWGVRTVGDLADLPEETVVAGLGAAHGIHLWTLAHGLDDQPVVPDQPIKSVGHEETFAEDHHTLASLEVEALRMSERVASRLRANHRAGRTVTVKVRFHDFTTITRSVTLPEPVDTAPAIVRAARSLLVKVDPAPGVRLLGVSVSGLGDGRVRQLSLLGESPATPEAWHDASRAIDSIRGRFGAEAIGPAALTDGGVNRA